eukprot:129419-Pyramimonas_sp.AAC.1
MGANKFYYDALDTIQKVRAMMHWAPLSLSGEVTGTPSTCTPSSMPSGTEFSFASMGTSGTADATTSQRCSVLLEASPSTRS